MKVDLSEAVEQLPQEGTLRKLTWHHSATMAVN
jgi:hypothetical protein